MLKIICGDCLKVIPTIGKIDVVITDPPFGVGVEYCHPDTPEYVRDVVVPAIQMCREVARAVIVMPGVRNLFLYPAADDIGCIYMPGGVGVGRWGFTCAQPILFYGADPFLARHLGSRPNSTGQRWPNDANQQHHPCAKPIAMMRWIVGRTSFEGETVLDPFCGSGSTGVAAVEGGRNFIGIELDPKHCATARARLKKCKLQQQLL